MSRPFMLYHWSPRARRKGIERHGLCPGKLSPDGSWRPPYVCYSRFPHVAWALSATHSGKRGTWDLWATWSDYAKPSETLNTGREPRKQWWLTEYRSKVRVPIRHVVYIGSREFKPRRRRK